MSLKAHMKICVMDMEYHIVNGYLKKGMINMDKKTAAFIMNLASGLIALFFLNNTDDNTQCVVIIFYCLLQSIYLKL